MTANEINMKQISEDLMDTNFDELSTRIEIITGRQRQQNH